MLKDCISDIMFNVSPWDKNQDSGERPDNNQYERQDDGCENDLRDFADLVNFNGIDGIFDF